MVARQADAASATGRRLDVPARALPTNIDAIAIEPEVYNRMDGFSSAAPLIIASGRPGGCAIR